MNLVLDEILEIMEVGDRDTYDFSIPETHCYFANGILVHNSADIEGDSDSVILIHREPKAANEENYKGEDGNFAPETLIRVSKARYSSGGDCYLIMDDKQCRLTEV